MPALRRSSRQVVVANEEFNGTHMIGERKIHDHDALWSRTLVTQARRHLAGAASLHQVILDQGFLDGSPLWWLDQQGITLVVPAKPLSP